MNREEYREFAKKAESLAKPVDITAISFLGDFNKYLPKGVQKSLMEKGSRSVPYMGFIVDPYCLFLAYEITDREKAQAMLPEGYELAETALFAGEKKRPLVVISSFAVRTSVFAGMRVECYIIARNLKTGLESWIIADYETNTTSHDPKNGFCGYSCDPAVFATTPYGELLVEAWNPKNGNEFSLRADLAAGQIADLYEGLWVEGNMSVDYGGKLTDPDSSPFSLIFDPYLMKEAKRLPLDAVSIARNTLLADIIDGAKPAGAALFPYAQHFVIRQDLKPGQVSKTEDLYGQLAVFMGGAKFKTMSGNDIKIPLLRSMIVSALVNAAIIGFLLFKLLF